MSYLCVLCSLLPLVGYAVVALFVVIVAILLSDADLRLMYAAKFGKQPESLAGKVVWITGASSGIGEHIAYCLAKAGARLVLSARRKDELERVKAACVSLGQVTESDVLVLPLDVVKYETHKEAVQKVLDHFQQIDVLMNNAGRSQRAAWLDVELDVDRDMFETNVLGQVSLTREVLPHMISRKAGLIAVMSSIAGKVGVPMSRSYTGTKHALNGYFGCLATEMSEHNIDVTIICPGPVFSNVTVHAATGKIGETVGRAMDKSEKKMSTERCAQLTCAALANRLYEVWISQNPVLFLAYVGQYMPDLGKWLILKFGVKQIMKMREGGK
ncbi:dehydrogenase/reductase SDR family member 7 [Aplysia californica]|uniref:Dehydrogenase/reductase SDR family member 7 n=1 Tax=Aplysia californica TaxID=6500 RepID=A0ABM0JU16_APLCA|nr:dehydrogenase/reductase SDR family member 7 [Aplysia californica]